MKIRVKETGKVIELKKRIPVDDLPKWARFKDCDNWCHLSVSSIIETWCQIGILKHEPIRIKNKIDPYGEENWEDKKKVDWVIKEKDLNKIKFAIKENMKTKFKEFLNESSDFSDWDDDEDDSMVNDDEEKTLRIYNHPRINPEAVAFNKAASDRMRIEDNLIGRKETRDLTFDPDKKITTIDQWNKNKTRLLVGYWATPDKVYYGNPVPNWKGWDDKELYKTFVDNLNNKFRVTREVGYKGSSECRICKTNNGSGEYVIDDKYVVPSGYVHYITKHKIEPHKWFLDYIMSLKIEKLPDKNDRIRRGDRYK